MDQQARDTLIAESVKNRKLVLPAHLTNLSDDQFELMDEKMDLEIDFLDALRDTLNVKYSVWSTGEHLDFNINPFHGAVGVTYKGFMIPFVDPATVTLAEIWEICDSLIATSGDLHHIFIETMNLDDENLIGFWCGS